MDQLVLIIETEPVENTKIEIFLVDDNFGVAVFSAPNVEFTLIYDMTVAFELKRLNMTVFSLLISLNIAP